MDDLERRKAEIAKLEADLNAYKAQMQAEEMRMRQAPIAPMPQVPMAPLAEQINPENAGSDYYITKVQGATEVLKRRYNERTMSLVGVVGTFATILTDKFSSIAGMAAAVGVIAFFAFMLFQNTQKIKYLEYTYGLTPTPRARPY